MGFLTFFYADSATEMIVEDGEQVKSETATEPTASASTQEDPRPKEKDGSQEANAESQGVTVESGQEASASPGIRRFSLRSFSFNAWTSRSPPGKEHEHAKKVYRPSQVSHHITTSDQRAKRSALLLRSLIIGPSGITPAAPRPSMPKLSRVKSQLMQPKVANKVIAQLRALPIGDDDGQRGRQGPIHAVCLAYTEEEADQRHFVQLGLDVDGGGKVEAKTVGSQASSTPNVATASVSALASMFQDMHLINLIKSPDLGIGQAGDGKGLLAGSVPTAETVINGITQVTPQLIALGFATGKMIVADHHGIYPPHDRMSVLTYWWGLELALPPPTLAYLASAQSVSGTVINFLSALALVNNGVREILPFVRYISQFIDFEFNSIRAQDKGKGVVCAATWIMPAALIPRPWDFPDPPTGVSSGDGQTPTSLQQTDVKDPHSVGLGPGGLIQVPEDSAIITTS